jgi:hypothetical protein
LEVPACCTHFSAGTGWCLIRYHQTVFVIFPEARHNAILAGFLASAPKSERLFPLPWAGRNLASSGHEQTIILKEMF